MNQVDTTMMMLNKAVLAAPLLLLLSAPCCHAKDNVVSLRGSKSGKQHGQVWSGEDTQNQRDLMAHMQHYQPLSCNAGVSTNSCVLWSAQNFDLSQEVVIPCGTCVQLDVSGTLVLTAGLSVDGLLYVPTPVSAPLTVATPHIFVQGDLVIDPPSSTVIPSENRVEFVLTGTDDQVFTPHASSMSTKTFTSKKPVVIAGGTLKVQGMPDTCPTWTRLQEVERDHAPIPQDYPIAPEASSLQGCSSVLVEDDFSSTSASAWDGHFAPVAEIQTDGEGESYFSVSGRTASYHSPRVNLGNVDCIVPNQPYLVSFRYRLTDSSGADDKTYVQPYLKMIREKTAGGKDWISPTFVYSRGSMSQVSGDGWYHAQYTVSFNEDQCDSTLTSNLYLYLQVLDLGKSSPKVLALCIRGDRCACF